MKNTATPDAAMKRYPCSAWFPVLAFALLATPVSAITITWTNTAGGDWGGATNWSPQQVPAASDVAVINGTAAFTITATGSRFVSGVVLDNPNATLRLLGQGGSGTATFTVANGFENHGTIELTTQSGASWAATLSVNSGTLTNAATGVIRTLPGAGGNRTLGLQLDNRGTLNIERSTDLILFGGRHRFAGTVNLAAGTILSISGGGSMGTTNAGALWTGTGTLDPPNFQPFVLETDLIISSITLDLQNVTVHGPGQLIVPTNASLLLQTTTINAPLSLLGTLENWASSTINSPFVIPTGAVVRLLGRESSGSSSLTISNGFENHGTIELTNRASSSWSTTLTITSGTLTNAAGGVIRSYVGAGGNRTLGLDLDNRGLLSIEQSTDLNKFNARHRFAGTVQLAAGATLALTGGGNFTTNAGAVWTGTGTLDFANFQSFILETDFTLQDITVDLQNVTVQGPGQFIVPPGRAALFYTTTMNAPVQLLGTLENWGSSSISGAFGVPSSGLVRLLGRASSGSSTLTIASGFSNLGIIELTNQNSSSWVTTLNVTTGALTNAPGGILRTWAGSGGSRTLGLELDNRGTFHVEQTTTLTKSVAKHRHSGTLHVADGVTLDVLNSANEFIHSGGSYNGTGTVSLPGSRTVTLETDLTLGTVAFIMQGLTVNGPGRFIIPPGRQQISYGTTFNTSVEIAGALEGQSFTTFNGAVALPASGLLRTRGVGGNAIMTVANGFENHGTIELTSDPGRSSTLDVTSGTLTNLPGAVILASPATNGGQATVDAPLDNRGLLQIDRETFLQGGTHQRNTGQFLVREGDLIIRNHSSFTNAGLVTIHAGRILFSETVVIGTVNTPTGIIEGDGMLQIRTSNGIYINQGITRPGLSPGILRHYGPWNQAASGELTIEMAGLALGTQYDHLVISNAATLGGTLRGQLLNGFSPKKDDTFTIARFPSRVGTFANFDAPAPDRFAWDVIYNPTNVQLMVLNSAPTLAAITNQTINEATLLLLTVSATDQDLPAQTLTYSLDTAPPGMTINASSGLVEWTPTETQGPGVYDVTVRATDNGTPVLFHTNSFTVTVNEVNVAPQLTVPGPQSVNELVELVFTVNATDADLPANALTYQMLSGPSGATFNPATREFRWTPTEAQGPGVSNAVFRVTDNNPGAVNTQQLSATNTVAITINEVNVAPDLAAVPNATLHAGTAYQFTLSATDSDLPANTLTYSLVTGPAGATVDNNSGLVSWDAPMSAAGATTNFTVRVTDNGVPPLPADRSFQVTVVGPLEITSYAREAGGFRVDWRSVPGLTYRLLSTPALPAVQWDPVGLDVNATSASSSRLDPSAGVTNSRFYRVLLVE